MKKLLLSMVLLVSTAAVAGDWKLWTESEQWEEGAAFVGLFNDSEYLRVSVSIGSGRDGKQRLYFEQVAYKVEDETLMTVCENSKENERTILNINGTNVRFNRTCIEFSDTEGSYLSLTPLSDAAVNYVLKQFINGNSVIIKNWPINVTLTAKGFTKEWHNFGGDAL